MSRLISNKLFSVNGVDDWEDKYRKGGNPLDRNENVSKLVAYEIIRRLEEHEVRLFGALSIIVISRSFD